MFAILNLIHWSRSNSNGYCALSLSGPVRYSPRRIRLVGANTFFLIKFHPFEFTCLKKQQYWYHLLFRLPLHEFRLLSLLNGNPSHHEPRKSGERRARPSLSKLLYLLWIWLHTHKQYTYGSHNFLLTLSDEFLTCYVKKTAMTIVHFFFD
jgi:hypothetical protein